MTSFAVDDRRASLLRAAVGLSPQAIPTRDTWSRWFDFAQLERVVPLLFQLVRRCEVDLKAEQESQLRDMYGATMARCVQLEHLTLEASGAIRAAGLEVVLLKGGATAHLDYAESGMRDFSDVDLLVRPTAMARTIQAVEELHWVQGYELPRFHRSLTHAVTFVRDRHELDLHQRIGHRSLGIAVPPDALVDATIEFQLAGCSMMALNDVDRLIHACIHAIASWGASQRLSTLADILVMTSRRPDQAEELRSRADEWTIRPLVAAAVSRAYEAAVLPVPDVWRFGEAPRSNRDRLIEMAYLGDHRRPLIEEAAYLRRLPGLRPLGAYVAGHLAPGRPYRRQHRRAGAFAQVRYLAQRMRRGSGA